MNGTASDHRVNVEGCMHDDEFMCSACAFMHFSSPDASCPLCRRPSRILVHAATGGRFDLDLGERVDTNMADAAALLS